MAGVIGNIEPFLSAQEDFESYAERIHLYFAANDVADGKKVLTFLTLIGSECYGLLKSLLSPVKPETKSLDVLIGTLCDHYSPKPLEIVERYKFHKCCQNESQSISEYVATLKKSAN